MAVCCQHHQISASAAATSRRALLRGAGGAALLGLMGCATNPETGRSQLLLVGDAELVGVGEAAYGSVGVAVVLSVFPKHMRATLTGAFMAGGMFGSVLGMALGGAIAASMGWRWAFAMLAVGPALGVLAMARLRVLPEATRMASGRR